ncbi:MAG: conjugal transfer protein TraF [Rickettsiaceae bacterium]|nr:conjugal transfer protein TraF [Rickettsiaceae bacterium]
MGNTKLIKIIIWSIMLFGLLAHNIGAALDLSKWTNTIDEIRTTKATQSIDGIEDIDSKFNKDYELLFIYSSVCGYCHQMAPILKQFAIAKNLIVKSVTADGGILSEFPDAKYMPNVLNQYNLSAYPTVMLISKSNGRAQIFSQGALTMQQLHGTYQSLVSNLYGGNS